MKKLLLLITLLSTVSATVALAQNNQGRSGVEYENLRGPFLTNGFWDNWFISAGAGVNGWVRPKKIHAESDHGLNKVGMVYQLGIGKMLAPNYGFRIQGNYGKIADYTTMAGHYTRYQFRPNHYSLKFNYWSIDVDGIFHLSNAIGGYKEARFYNIMLLAGAGIMRSNGRNITNDKSHNTEFSVNAAILNTFRLAKCLDAYLELKTNIVRQDFAGGVVGYSSHSGVGLIVSATAGLTVKFNKRNFTNTPRVVFRDVERVVEMVREVPVEKVITIEKNINVNNALDDAFRAVAFDFGKAKITDDSSQFLDEIARFMISNQGNRYLITGFTDAVGPEDFNQRLSEERAQAVVDALVSRGVPASTLKSRGEGMRIATVSAGASEEARGGDRKVTVELITNNDYWEYLSNKKR